MQSEAATVDLLQQGATEHHTLLARAKGTSGEDVAAILNLGSAVLLHGVLERSQVYAANQYLAAAVIEQLTVEHARLADDLALLEDFRQTDPESPDLVALSASLLERLLDHLERDERTLYRSLERFKFAEQPRPAEGTRRDVERED